MADSAIRLSDYYHSSWMFVLDPESGRFARQWALPWDRRGPRCAGIAGFLWLLPAERELVSLYLSGEDLVLRVGEACFRMLADGTRVEVSMPAPFIRRLTIQSTPTALWSRVFWKSPWHNRGSDQGIAERIQEVSSSEECVRDVIRDWQHLRGETLDVWLANRRRRMPDDRLPH
jgi:hypothetical protein